SLCHHTGDSESSTSNTMQKPKYAGRRGVVGEPYEDSICSTPRPTNDQVWERLVSRPVYVRPARQPIISLPRLTLQYLGGALASTATRTRLVLSQQPAGGQNLSVFSNNVNIG
ncbi:unnamed protein product, partial [Meganyctiphanes norvegica]